MSVVEHIIDTRRLSPVGNDVLDVDASIEDFAAFFDVSLDMLCIRTIEGPVIKVSRSWHTVLGYEPSEIEGRTLLPLVHPDDVEGTLGSIVEVEQRGLNDPVLGFINRYRHKDGRYRTLEWRAQKHGDRIHAVARDITDRVVAEQALIDAMATMEAASRAKSDFLANMSHEIRTPLNGVIGIVDALSRTTLTPEQREMVALVQTSGRTLERLVSDILDVSKIEAERLEIEYEPFDLGETLGAVLNVARSRADEKGLDFKIVAGPDARGRFFGDTTRISQVLANLLSNAVKFTALGGLTVRVDVQAGKDAQTELTVDIHDTGIGFDADQAARLFDRFNQADTSITRQFGGTGLGLSICRSLVEMMGGEISARSLPGKGSTFSVRLPLSRTQSLTDYDARQVKVAAPVEPERRSPERPLRVLLADDHPINQRVVQMILVTQRAEIVTVGDGAQALEAFKRESFDLVLMDMQMPVMDGLAATRAIRRHEALMPGLRRTPVAMLSANAMAEHRNDAIAAGADHHIPKPITAETLLAGIEVAMGAFGVKLSA